MWYSNDKDFAKEIPGFNRNNKYMMRFRGYYVAASAGTYGFQTCSDDGSMIYIKDKLVVNNDGDHGRKCKSANVKLTKGWNKLTVTFYECVACPHPLIATFFTRAPFQRHTTIHPPVVRLVF
jgi:hypothetical protein